MKVSICLTNLENARSILYVSGNIQKRFSKFLSKIHIAIILRNCIYFICMVAMVLYDTAFVLLNITYKGLYTIIIIKYYF